LELRPFGPEDFNRLIGWLKSPWEVMSWGGVRWTWPLDPEQLERYLGPSRGPRPSRRVYAALEDGAVVGHADFSGLLVGQDSATICRVLIGPAERRGHGLGRRLMEALCREGFVGLGLYRLELNVLAGNEPALRCYRAAGFIEEGTLRRARRFAGERYDVVHMGLLRPEWERRER
jgi:RimJ/RimL family protein N-acetyltransferase